MACRGAGPGWGGRECGREHMRTCTLRQTPYIVKSIQDVHACRHVLPEAAGQVLPASEWAGRQPSRAVERIPAGTHFKDSSGHRSVPKPAPLRPRFWVNPGRGCSCCGCRSSGAPATKGRPASRDRRCMDQDMEGSITSWKRSWPAAKQGQGAAAVCQQPARGGGGRGEAALGGGHPPRSRQPAVKTYTAPPSG